MTCQKCDNNADQRHSRGCKNSKKFEKLTLNPLTKDIPLWKRTGFKTYEEVQKKINTLLQ